MKAIYMSGESRYVPNTAVDYMMVIGSDRDTILYAERPINSQMSEEETLLSTQTDDSRISL